MEVQNTRIKLHLLEIFQLQFCKVFNVNDSTCGGLKVNPLINSGRICCCCHHISRMHRLEILILDHLSAQGLFHHLDKARQLGWLAVANVEQPMRCSRRDGIRLQGIIAGIGMDEKIFCKRHNMSIHNQDKENGVS